jgi:glycosyltransferase involved in cell wall biosynthesis
MDQKKQTTSGIASKLSILIPAYNEQYFVEQLINKVLDVPLPLGIERELVIVDDCSTDDTPAILARIAAAHPDIIRLYMHDHNQGKGAAIRTTIQHATGDICIIQDADLEYDPSDYQKLIQPILDGDADAVFGSRYLPSDRRRVLYFWHTLMNKSLTTFSNMFTNLDLTDMETGYKTTRTSILKSIPLRSNRFDLEPELTAKLAKRGCRIYEVPISYRGRSYEEGKKITWTDGVRAIWKIIYFRFVDDIYDTPYGHAVQHRLSQTHRFNAWLADTVAPWVGERVLEIGARLGNMTLKLMPRHHYVVSDVDPLHLDYLKSRFGNYSWMDVKKIDLENAADFAPLQERFDTVVCLDVLEHVDEDERALENIYRALIPGGSAILVVPQGKWLYSSLDRIMEYRRRYSRQELTEKCERVGFKINKVASFNRIGSLVWLLNSCLLRRKNLGKLQLKIFDSFIWVLRRIDKFLPLPGLSLIGVVQKPETAPKTTDG